MEPQTPQTNETPITQAPIIPESQMKMPEEAPGGALTPDTNRHGFNPWLIGLLVFLLLMLAAAVIWGEEIVGLVLPAETTAPVPESQSADQSTINDLNALESEMEETDWSELDAEMAAMEAEIEAELAATSTAN